MILACLLASLGAADSAAQPSPDLLAGPSPLEFSVSGAEGRPAARTIFLASSGAPLSYQAKPGYWSVASNWLSVTPAAGATPATLTVSADASNLASGVYFGYVEITPAAAKPVILPVTLRVGGAGDGGGPDAAQFDVAGTRLKAEPGDLIFRLTPGEPAPPAQTIAIAGPGGILNYSVSTDSGAWLAAGPQTGSTSDSSTVSVAVNPANLPAGTNTGFVTVSAPGTGTLRIPITVMAAGSAVIFPALPAASGFSVDKTSITLQGSLSGPAQTQTIQLTSSPNDTYFASGLSTLGWLSVSPASGTTPATLTVKADPAFLTAANTYTGYIQIYGQANTSPQYVFVTYIVSGGSSTGAITASPASVQFAQTLGSAAPPAQTVQLSAAAATSFTAASTNAAWLTVTPSSGTTPATLTLNASAAGLAANTYQGSVTVMGGGTTRTIPVTFTVTASATSAITASPASVQFAQTLGGAAPPAQTVQLSAAAAASFTAASTNAAWLTVAPSSGTTPATLTLNASAAGLTANTYQGSVTVTGGGTTLTIPVTFTVTASGTNAITASPTSVQFAQTLGSAAPPAQTVQLSAAAAASFTAASTNAAWLTVAPSSGTTPATLTLNASAAGLTANTYQGSVTVMGGGTTLTIPVTFTVSASATIAITASPSSLIFGQTLGGAGFEGKSVRLSTAAAASFTAASNASWLTVNPSSGTAPTNVTVYASAAGLAANTYQGSITITAAGMTAVIIPVTLTVSAGTVPITATPSPVSFAQTQNGAVPDQTVQLSAAIPQDFSVSAISAPWLFVVPIAGTTPASLKLSASPVGLAANTYQGSVTVMGGGAALTIPVTFTVSAGGVGGAITATPISVSFAQTLGSADPPAQTVQLSAATATGFTAASTNAAWLTVAPSSGTTPATLTLNASAAGLAANTYQGAVTVTGGGTTVTIPVTFTVSGSGTTAITAAPSSVSFVQTVGAAPPSPQTVQLSGGDGTGFTAVSTASWLNVSPPSGNTPAALTLTVNAAGLTATVYQGAVTVTTGGTTLSIPVTLTVSSAGTSAIAASPPAVIFSQVAGQNAFSVQTVQLSAAIPEDFAVSSSVPWLSVLPASGTTPATLTVSAAGGMTAGTYQTAITVTGGISPVSIPVMLTVSSAPNAITASSASISFSQVLGGTAPAAQTVQLSSPSPTNFTVSNTSSWLTAAPASGTTPASLALSVNTSGLTAGTYQDTVTVAGGAAPVTIPVTLTLNPDTFVAAPASLSFAQTLNGTAPSSQTVQLTSSVARNYTASTSSPWLSVGPASGTTPASLTVTANGAGLALGAYQGSITVNGAGAPFTIPVTFTIAAATGAAFSPATLAFSYAGAGSQAPPAQTVAVTSPGSQFAFTAAATAAAGGTWLSVTPASGTTPASLTVSVSPAGLAAGRYSGLIAVTPTDTTIPPQTLAVTLTVSGSSGGTVFVRSILNAASLLPGPIAPGEIITLTGTGLGPAIGLGPSRLASGAVDTLLGGTRVLFDGIPAPLLFVRADQINAIVPYNVYGRTGTNLQVEISGLASDPIGLRAVNTSPALFSADGSGRGQVSIVNQDGTINSPSAPAAIGSVISLYGTGEGQTNPSGQDGRIVSTDLRTPIAPVSVKIGGVAAEVRYVGSAPGQVSGLFQLNATVPAGLAANPQTAVEVRMEGVSTQFGITMAVK